MARQTFANICCGTYSCTKYDANGNVLDDYLSTCGGAACSGSGGGGCNAGYDMDDSGCEWKAGSSCGSTGSTPTPSSFMAGTMVSTPLGGKKIEDLKVGDRVISFTGNTIVESIVSKTHKVRRDYYFDLVADGYRVKVTAKHPFYIGSDEFKTAEELKAGDNVYVLENKSLVKKRVTSKTRVEKKADVYNLTVDGTNTYFAGGFAVHNKGGSYSCPAGTYPETYNECKNECSGGWQNGGNCDTNPCGKNNKGKPKVCCHKGFCIPVAPSNFSFICNGDNTVTFAWSVNPAATRYALRVNDLSNGWAGDQKNNNCTTINPGDACVNDLPIDPTLYTFPITYGNVYNAWIYTVAGNRMSEEASYLYNMTCPATTPFPCPANINQSCNGSGTQATISWDAIAAAVGYVLRLNHEPYDAPTNWYNAGQGDQWQEPTSSTINVAITPGANYQYSVQGKAPGESYPYAGGRCPYAIFNCPAPTPTAIPTPVGTIKAAPCG